MRNASRARASMRHLLSFPFTNRTVMIMRYWANSASSLESILLISFPFRLYSKLINPVQVSINTQDVAEPHAPNTGFRAVKLVTVYVRFAGVGVHVGVPAPC